MMKFDKKMLKEQQYKSAKGYEDRLALLNYGEPKFNIWEWTASHYDFAGAHTILEVGCGTGGFWQYAESKLQPNQKIILTDFSEGMLAGTKENLKHSPLWPQMTFELADVDDLKYETGSMDVVLAHFMLYHAQSPEKALSEITRVLSKNGWVGITTGSKKNLAPIFELAHEVDNRIPPYPVVLVPFSEDTADALLPRYFKSIQKHSISASIKISIA